jgi:hypothetical protein
MEMNENLLSFPFGENDNYLGKVWRQGITVNGFFQILVNKIYLKD